MLVMFVLKCDFVEHVLKLKMNLKHFKCLSMGNNNLIFDSEICFCVHVSLFLNTHCWKIIFYTGYSLDALRAALRRQC